MILDAEVMQLGREHPRAVREVHTDWGKMGQSGAPGPSAQHIQAPTRAPSRQSAAFEYQITHIVGRFFESVFFDGRTVHHFFRVR